MADDGAVAPPGGGGELPFLEDPSEVGFGGRCVGNGGEKLEGADKGAGGVADGGNVAVLMIQPAKAA